MSHRKGLNSSLRWSGNGSGAMGKPGTVGICDTRQGGEGSTLDQKAGRVTVSERSDIAGVKGAAGWDCCVPKLKARD